jgi:outer membrane lipase/esterase
MKFNPRRAAATAALALTGAVLSACGGGGGQVDPFRPERLLAFGDENSLLTSDGKRYSINGFKTDANNVQSFDCTANPIWLQTVANGFGLVLKDCNPNNLTVTSSVYAQVGAKVSDVRAQIDGHLASGTLGPKDLVTLMVGSNDVLELYAQYPSQTVAQLLTAAGNRGRELADQVNRIANANGRVVILTQHNLGLSPFALAEKAANTDIDRAALLRDLSNEFTRQVRLNIINDGRLIGLVLADEDINRLAQFPGSFGLVDVTQAACAVALPNCNTNTLVANASAATWLWADAKHLGPTAHTQLGSAALSRAANNPF